MTIEEALVSFLMADPAVTSLIGQSLFPGDAPAGQPAPYVIYESTGTQRDSSLQQDTHLPTIDLELTAYASTKVNATAIRRTMRNSSGGGAGPMALSEFHGLMGSAPGVQVQGTWIDHQGGGGGEIETQDASGQPAWKASMTLRITYVEQTTG
jgi:hypothetical protein